MRVDIQAESGELEDKAPDLIRSISNLLRETAPELAEDLLKAVRNKDVNLRYPVLFDLQKKTELAYADHLRRMVAAIGKVVDRGIRKDG